MELKTEYPKLVEAQKTVCPELPDWDKTPPFVEAINLLGHNLQDTVDFIEQDCSAEQLVWMSVIAVDVACILKDKRFTEAMKKTSKKYAAELEGYNVDECIADAERKMEEV